MISVPPRLGKCKGCREKKIECDKKRPRCTQCVAADTSCGGYDMGTIFININATGPPPPWQSQNDQKYLVLDLAAQPITTPHNQDLDLSANYATYGANYAATIHSTHSHTNLSQPDPKNLVAMTQLFVELFYGRHNPNKSCPCPFQEGTEVGCWRSLLPLWLGLSPILDAAIGALVTCFVGTQYRDMNLIDESRDLYLKALRLVQDIPPEPNAPPRKDLLATSLVMSSTELFMSNGGGPSQLTHIEGAARLLRERLTKPPFEELHIYLLNQGLFESLASRRAYTFSNPSYRTLIGQLYSAPRSYPNDLYFKWCELVLPLPNILGLSDSLCSAASSGNNSTAAIVTMLDEIAALEKSLMPWEEALKSSMAGPWALAEVLVGENTRPPPLQFVSIEACLLYTLHWTSSLLILECRQILTSKLPAFSSHSDQPTLSQETPAELASLICRSVQFCTSNTPFAVTENMCLPLKVVAAYYARNEEEDGVKWCESVVMRISEENNIRFGHIDLEEHRRQWCCRIRGFWSGIV